MEGWIKLYRKIQECDFLWNSSDEPFDKRSAWIDLLLLANHRDKRIVFRGNAITVRIGQRITSLRVLSDRWHWGINRTSKFLDMLEEEQMIERESDNHKTLITIVNYEKYQAFSGEDETQTDTHTDTQTNTQTDTEQIHRQIHRQITNKNDKNEKNEKNEKNTIPPQTIADMFNDICLSYPRLRILSEPRKAKIRTRLKNYTIDDFRTMFEKAEASSFLKGGNGNWSASFDWMLEEKNMVKILEGNYDNREQKKDDLSDAYDMMRKWAEKGEANDTE